MEIKNIDDNYLKRNEAVYLLNFDIAVENLMISGVYVLVQEHDKNVD